MDFRFLGACLLLYTFSLPAFAAKEDVGVTIANNSPYELHRIKIVTEKGEESSSVQTVPGNSCTIAGGGASSIKAINIVSGKQLFTFDNLNLAGNSNAVTFAVAEMGPPVLLSENKVSDNPESTVFGMEADFIEGNDQAKTQCLGIVQEWNTFNTGWNAEWTGKWSTASEETSVCRLKILGREDDAHIVAGTMESVLAQTAPVQMDRLFSARTVGDLRALGIQKDPLLIGDFILPVELFGIEWNAHITAEKKGALGNIPDNSAIYGITMYAETTGEELRTTIKALLENGWKPWLTHIKHGENMETADIVHYRESGNVSEEEETLASESEAAFRMEEPVSLETVFLAENAWEAAAKAKDFKYPALVLRVSNSITLTLAWHSDATKLVQPIR